MKHFLTAVGLGCLLLAGNAHALDTLTVVQIFDQEPVASTGSVTSDIIRTKEWGGIETIVFKAASASGDTDVKIEYLICIDPQTCGDVSDIADLTSDSAADFTGAPEGLNKILCPVIGAPYFKIVVTGINTTATNAADTLVDLWLVVRNNTN